jgi:hypothetical protein
VRSWPLELHDYRVAAPSHGRVTIADRPAQGLGAPGTRPVVQFDDERTDFVDPLVGGSEYFYFRPFDVDFQNVDAREAMGPQELIDRDSG